MTARSYCYLTRMTPKEVREPGPGARIATQLAAAILLRVTKTEPEEQGTGH